jgi:transcriptional regulator with XRE-family HTH domain
MPTLAAYQGMMQRARKGEGLRVCRAAWLVGVSVREYREFEAGDRMPSLSTYERISELYGWPETFVGQRPSRYQPGARF